MEKHKSPICGNFILLRTTFTIDGNPVKAKNDKGFLTLCSESSNASVSFESFLQNVDEVLQSRGLGGVSNYWCQIEKTPFFELKVTSTKDLKTLLKSRQEIQNGLASKISMQLTPGSNTTPSVGVECQTYVLIPDYSKMDGKVIPVTEETLTSCMALCIQNGVFDFTARLVGQCLNPGALIDTGPTNLAELVQDLKEVVDWKQFGLLIDVADYELENIDESVRGPKKCRYEMLRHWMQTEVNKKWLTVVNALAQMCHGVLATTIALKYGLPPPEKKDLKFPKETAEEKNLTAVQKGLQGEKQQLLIRITEKDEQLAEKKEALINAQKEKEILRQEMKDIRSEEKKSVEEANKLIQEKIKLEGELRLKQQELGAMKQSSEKDSAEFQALISARQKECDEISEKLKSMESAIEKLTAEKAELEKTLMGKNYEVEFLKKSAEREEMHLKREIASKEQQIEQGSKELQSVKESLENEKNKIRALNDELEKTKEKLSKKSQSVRKLRKSKEEDMAELQREREKCQRLRKELEAAKASPVKHKKEIDSQIAALKERARQSEQRATEKHNLAEKKDGEIKELTRIVQQKTEELEKQKSQRSVPSQLSIEEVLNMEKKVADALYALLEVRERLTDAEDDKHMASTKASLSREEAAYLNELVMVLQKKEVPIPLSLKFESKRRAPVAMYKGAATTDGRMAYFMPRESNTIYCYNAERDEWTEIAAPLPFPYSDPGLAIVNGLLTCVGGVEDLYKVDASEVYGRYIRQIFSYKDDNWVELHPPMTEERSHSTAVSRGSHIVVAGGVNNSGYQRTIDVFNADFQCWFLLNLPQLEYLPISTCSLSANTFYGMTAEGAMYSSSLQSLLDQQPAWVDLPAYSFHDATLVMMSDRLLAIGGKKEGETTEVATDVYELFEGKWESVGNLETARCQCLAAVGSDGEAVVVVVAGGVVKHGVYPEPSTEILEVGTLDL